jgi:hypothetical protein
VDKKRGTATESQNHTENQTEDRTIQSAAEDREQNTGSMLEKVTFN